MIIVKNVSMQLWVFVVTTSLFLSPVSASENKVDDSSHTGDTVDFHLSGVLVSANGRSALVNKKIAQEGDYVAGVRILSIEEGGVRVLVDNRELTVRVGSTAALAKNSRTSNPLPDNLKNSYGPVLRGETLSEIAEQHLHDEITINQMMVALFQANPGAFDKNINLLREGAILRIPDSTSLLHHAAATKEVGRHMDAWHIDEQQPVQLAQLSDSATYGPVVSGETLSGIAVRLSDNDTSMEQTIAALFHANPQAFGADMNVLHVGAVLRIPDTLHQRSPTMASTDVARQADVSQRDYMWPGETANSLLLSMIHNE